MNNNQKIIEDIIVLLQKNNFDGIVVENVRTLLNRSAVGVAKYGTTLENANLTHLQLSIHLLEELLDAANYVRTNIETERERLSKSHALGNILYKEIDTIGLYSPKNRTGMTQEDFIKRIKEIRQYDK